MVSSKKEKRKGELYIFGAGFLWAFFPVITLLSYAKLHSLVSLAWTTLISTIFFAILLSIRKKWGELKNVTLWKHTFFVVAFIGVCFYGLYFIGLEGTTAGNASIIALFEVFTAYVFFHIIRKERVTVGHLLGSLLMVVGAAIVLAPNVKEVHRGDLIILLAMFFPPIGNLFQQKARKIASSESIMFLRSLLSTPILFLIVFFLGQNATFENIKASIWFLVINGFLLFGLSKLMWIEAIHRIPVAKGVALSSLNPFLTLLISWLILKEVPNAWQFLSLVPLIFGVLLLTDQLVVNKRLPKRFEEFITID